MVSSALCSFLRILTLLTLYNLVVCFAYDGEALICFCDDKRSFEVQSYCNRGVKVLLMKVFTNCCGLFIFRFAILAPRHFRRSRLVIVS